jgi:hypothetical protein
MKETIAAEALIAKSNNPSTTNGGNGQPTPSERQTRRSMRVTYTDPHSEDELAGEDAPPQTAPKKRATPRLNAKTKVIDGSDLTTTNLHENVSPSKDRDTSVPESQTPTTANGRPKRTIRTPATPATQPSQKRKTPTSKAKSSFVIRSDDADFTTQPTNKRTKPGTEPKPAPSSSTTNSRAEVAKNRKYEALHAVTSDKSPLITGNLLAILQSPEAWTCLSGTQQRELVGLLPPAASVAMRAEESVLVESCDVKGSDGGEHVGENAGSGTGTGGKEVALPNIPLARLKRSSAFQTDVRQFQDDLRDGKLDPIWMEMAANASARRQAGEFDAWRKKEIERTWELEDEEEEKEEKEEVEEAPEEKPEMEIK